MKISAAPATELPLPPPAGYNPTSRGGHPPRFSAPACRSGRPGCVVSVAVAARRPGRGPSSPGASSMTTLRWFCAAALALTASASSAQDFPKPGPEHDVLKKLVGTWDATMKVGGGESKGVMTYKMGVGDLWLLSSFEGEFGGQKFAGKGFDSFDQHKKKDVGIWVDSMVTAPLVMEGTFDAAKKAMTMTGEATGPDGKPMKYKNVTTWKDDDNVTFEMYSGDEKTPGFTI